MDILEPGDYKKGEFMKIKGTLLEYGCANGGFCHRVSWNIDKQESLCE